MTMSKSKQSQQGQNPGHGDSGVVPFAFLNHDLEPEPLRQWIAEIAKMGVDGIFLHARIGLLTPYFSEAWFDRIRLCVEEGARQDINIWLYDEYNYPGGSAGGKLVAEAPEMAERHLKVLRQKVEGGTIPIAEVGVGRVVEAFLIRRDDSGKIAAWERVTQEIGPVGQIWTRNTMDSRHYYDLRYAERYDCPRSSSYQLWHVWPVREAEQWEELVVFIECRNSYIRSSGEYVDISSPETAAAFLKATHEEYFRRFGQYFGTVIPGIFTDEPKYHNALPWSRRIAAQWKTYQTNPESLLALVEETPGASALREGFRELTGTLFTENWFGPITRWCASHSLTFTGHISPEEDWPHETTCCGSILKTLRTFPMPGCDLIIPAVGDRRHPILNLMPVLACSAAAQEGRNRVMCELFAVSDFGMTVQDMKRISDWLTLFGVNFFVPHGLFYSIDGDRKYDAPPTFSSPSTLAPYFEFWAEEARQSADRLGPGGVVVDVLIVRPMRRIAAERDPRTSPRSRSLYEKAMEATLGILERGLMVHWIDDSELAEVQVHEGRVHFHQASYSFVLHFEDSLEADEARLLEALREAGASVFSEKEIHLLPSPLKDESRQVRISRTRDGGCFAVNLEAAPADFALNDTTYSLAGYESRWLSEVPDRAPAETAGERLAAWTIRPMSENCAVLKTWEVNGIPKPLGPLFQERPELVGPLTASFLGEVPLSPILKEPASSTYRTVFHTDSPMSLRLVIEEDALVGDWTASLDGRPLEIWIRRTTYDRFNRECLLGNLPTGRHELVISMEMHSSTGGMRDFCRLFGDFQLASDPDNLRLLAPGSLPMDASDWSVCGFPHYSGMMEYSTEFTRPEDNRPVFCRATAPLCDQALVWLNDKQVAPLAWSPWQIELTEFLIPGTNRLQLQVSNSLHNMIYGEARRSGLGDAEIRLH